MLEQIRAKHTDARALALRAAAITMGFVFFAGGWRRFYNAPAKLDIDSAGHLANKLVGAAPGSPIESIIHWVLYHPWAMEWSAYLMSAIEVIVGLALILGLLTRLTALGAALINIALMLIFGWQGAECLDEWTMAALGFAVSISVMLDGTGALSIDHALQRDFFAAFIGRKSAITVIVFSVLFTFGFYSYYFGFFDFEKRTSTAEYSIIAESGEDHDNVATLYVNAGGTTGAAYVKSITFAMSDGSTRKLKAADIDVIGNHFAPWSESGGLVDNLLKLKLGSKTDIKVPKQARGATIKIIDNPDQKINL